MPAVDYGGLLDIDGGLLKQLNTRLKSWYYYNYHMTCSHTFRQHELCDSTFIQTTNKVLIRKYKYVIDPVSDPNYRWVIQFLIVIRVRKCPAASGRQY